MTTERSNGWTPEDDRVLTEIVLDGLRKRKTQIESFKRAGRKLDRTYKACGFRWNKVIREHFTAEIEQAKREGRYYKGEAKSLPVDKITEEAKEQLLSWEKALADRERRLIERDAERDMLDPEPIAVFDSEGDAVKFVEAFDAPTPTKPAHYHKGGIDVIGFLEQHFGKDEGYSVAEGFYIGNIIKYVSRYKQKNGVEDLQKAKVYLEKLKQHRGE